MSVSKNLCSAHDEISSEFTLIWKITNLSYCAMSKGQRVESPTFKFRPGSSAVHEWKLFLYPQGRNTTSVECGLSSKPNNSQQYYPGKLDCHICVCSTKELLLCSGYSELNFLDSGKYSIEFQDLASFGREIFERLSDDAIVLHCHLKKLESDKREGLVHCFVETRLSILRNIFYWKVDNFKSLQLEEEKSCDWLIYPAFDKSSGSMNMTSKLFLSGTDLKDATVQIRFTFDGLEAETFSSCALFLMDENEKVVKHLGKDCLLGPIGNILKFSFKHEELSCRLSTDSLIIKAEVNLAGDNGAMDQVVYGMKTIEAIAAVKRSGIPELPTDSLPFLPASSENCPSSLPADMLSLYKGDGPPSDFELLVAGRSFPVHQTVLGARSTVFRAMFASNMRETSERGLELTDVDVDTAERMLLYAYADQEPSPDLNWDSLADLYAASDKYALLGLKKMCGERLARRLDVENAPRLLLIADRHTDQPLKKQVMDYIIEHGPSLMESENWEKLVQEHPKLAVDVLYHLMKD